MDERPTSEFSRVISRHLQAFMREEKIDQADVARLIGKGRSYVSEHTNGTRSPTTDIIDAIAELADVPTIDLVSELLRRMDSLPGVRGESEEDKARRLMREALARRGGGQRVVRSSRNSGKSA